MFPLTRRALLARLGGLAASLGLAVRKSDAGASVVIPESAPLSTFYYNGVTFYDAAAIGWERRKVAGRTHHLLTVDARILHVHETEANVRRLLMEPGSGQLFYGVRRPYPDRITLGDFLCIPQKDTDARPLALHVHGRDYRGDFLVSYTIAFKE